LFSLDESRKISLLSTTMDDAAGEALDKGAKLLGLGYPGGPQVEKLAKNGNASAFEFPKAVAQRSSLEFSFSGLKTAVAQYVAAQKTSLDDAHMADICAAFQYNVVSVLVEKALAACERRNVPRLVLTGGVAANRGLRALAAEACQARGVSLFVPPFASCTDNAAMIAYAGSQRLILGEDDGLGLSVFSRSPILGASAHSAAAPRYKSSRLPRPSKPA
jgi:N6-L-threonylcarbamoyladenine synthase